MLIIIGWEFNFELEENDLIVYEAKWFKGLKEQHDLRIWLSRQVDNVVEDIGLV